MEKQTKNIITRASIEKELRFSLTASLKMALIWAIPVALVFIPITVACINAILGEFNNLIIEIILSTLLGGGMILPVLIVFFVISGALLEKRKLDKGEFEVVVRTLLYKEEKYEYRGRRHRTRKIFHFSDFDEVTQEGTIYDLARADDEFYLVRYTGKRSAKLVYPVKMYEYKEN